MESKRSAKVERRVEPGTGELARTSNYPFCLCPSPGRMYSPFCYPSALALFFALSSTQIAAPTATRIAYPQFERPAETTSNPGCNPKYPGEKL